LTCLDAGMDDFLTKPVSPAKLIDIVAKWLASSRAA
jgi:CheY-like chemotaxis protein